MELRFAETKSTKLKTTRETEIKNSGFKMRNSDLKVDVQFIYSCQSRSVSLFAVS